MRQAYRFFASFRKSICKGFNYIKVRTGRAIRNLPTGKKGRYASKGIKIRAVIQPGAPFWQVRLTEWQKKKMHEIKIDTIGELIGATEERLKQAKYIADVRARNIKNAGIAAVCEYLLG